MNEPDWHAAEDRIIEETTRAIDQFSAQHPNEMCSCLAFAVDCCYGDVALCFDTLESSLRHAKAHQRRILREWDRNLTSERGWEDAESFITRRHTHNRLVEYCPFPGDEFKYPRFSILHFQDWQEFFLSDERNDEEPDPTGHVIVILHNVINGLTQNPVLGRLRMSTPFRVGVSIAEIQEPALVVMRILNWPE